MAKPLIMVVDDELQVADFIAQTIKETDLYDVVTAYSATAALELLARNKILLGLGGNKIKLIVLDIKMPGMNGLEFLEIVRKDYSEKIGVTMLTAWEDAEKWDKATSGMVINYIRKPFKSEELLVTLDNFFKGKDAEMILATFEKHINKREEFKQPPENEARM